MLTCSFDDGLCGWKNPENASRTWMLNNGISMYLSGVLHSLKTMVFLLLLH
jgi:hypothetical protein